jgi:hypothetical protein
MKTLAVGCGAGFSGDRVDAAAPVVRTLIERGGPAAQFIYPLRIMCMISIPAMMILAPQNDLKPSIGRGIRLVAQRCKMARATKIPSYRIIFSTWRRLNG